MTSPEIIAPLIFPALDRFCRDNQNTTIRYEASERFFDLEYGEAHVAIRAGAKAEHPDNVVTPFMKLRSGLYAHRSYAAVHGLPDSPSDYASHRFISDATRGSSRTFARWLRALVPEANIVFSCENGRINFLALRAGLGIGVYPEFMAQADPNMLEVCPPREDWDVPFSIVTHVDQHRTPKVQAVLEMLRDPALPRG